MTREAIEGELSVPLSHGCRSLANTPVRELGPVDSLQDKPSRRRSRKKKTATADAETSAEIDGHAVAFREIVSNCNVSEVDGRTTLMLRNIPNSYGRDALIALLGAQGLSGCYNFVYLPIDFARQSSLGFAFVNMVDTACAETAMRRLQGFHNWSSMSPKVLQVTWSHPVQGLTAHLERYRNSPVMHEDIPDAFKPAYFVDGCRAPFPESSRRVRLPRARPSRT
jgi:RNA recognition motif-containing protein